MKKIFSLLIAVILFTESFFSSCNVYAESMVNICQNMVNAAKRYNMEGNYVAGANIAGFEKVVEAMTAQGIV